MVRTGIMVTEPVPRPEEPLQRLRAPAFDRTSTQARAPASLLNLKRDVQGCRRCPLWRDATQAVCGEGRSTARLMIVGEQPGDQEDLAGRPFIGPAGRLLDAALMAGSGAKTDQAAPDPGLGRHGGIGAAGTKVCRSAGAWQDDRGRRRRPRSSDGSPVLPLASA